MMFNFNLYIDYSRPTQGRRHEFLFKIDTYSIAFQGQKQ